MLVLLILLLQLLHHGMKPAKIFFLMGPFCKPWFNSFDSGGVCSIMGPYLVYGLYSYLLGMYWGPD